MLIIAATLAAIADPRNKPMVELNVPASVLADDIVVSAATGEPQDIKVAIRSHEADYGVTTTGLVEGAKPTSANGATIDLRLAAEAARDLH